MPSPRTVLLAVLSAALATACSQNPRPTDPPVAPPPEPTTTTVDPVVPVADPRCATTDPADWGDAPLDACPTPTTTVAPEPTPPPEPPPEPAPAPEPILCPRLAHPAHHRPCPAPAAHTHAAPHTHASAPAPAGGQLARIRACESGGDYTAVSGQYRGAYQFDAQTHRSVGGDGNAADDTPAEQDAAATRLLAMRGTQPWPVCGR